MEIQLFSPVTKLFSNNIKNDTEPSKYSTPTSNNKDKTEEVSNHKNKFEICSPLDPNIKTPKTKIQTFFGERKFLEELRNPERELLDLLYEKECSGDTTAKNIICARLRIWRQNKFHHNKYCNPS